MGAINASVVGSFNTSSLTATIPKTDNVVLALANTEYSLSLPNNTKQYRIQNRDTGLVKIAFVATESATKYWTLYPGQAYADNALNLQSVIIYFQSTSSNQTVEVVSWS